MSFTRLGNVINANTVGLSCEGSRGGGECTGGGKKGGDTKQLHIESLFLIARGKHSVRGRKEMDVSCAGMVGEHEFSEHVCISIKKDYALLDYVLISFP